jgi:hypothetical protein
MKIALLGDTHYGARNDAASFHDYFERFYSTVFFPYLEKEGITEVIQLGDLFDRRKYINFLTLSRSRQYFFDPLKEHNINLSVFVGNHDTFYKNTNEINSPQLLLGEYDNISVYSEYAEVYYDDVPIVLLPWVNSSNLESVQRAIDNTKAQILFGHLELAGFEMYRGVFHDHGMSASMFDKFDIVCSGHFHHRSSKGNIHYLGTPYEMTWSDYNDPRGFHIFDTETRELKFIVNPYCMFSKLHYDDTDKLQHEIMDIDIDKLRNTFIKIVVHNKNNPYWFDMYVDMLEKAGVADIQIVEDHLNLNLEDDSDIIDEAEDTLTILRKVVDNIDTKNVTKKELDNFLTNLYSEALHVE